jgi:protein TonB
MKLVKFPSRGGDYLVVANQIAYLRKHENGQNNIGMVGGDYLLVSGSIEETAATILAG